MLSIIYNKKWRTVDENTFPLVASYNTPKIIIQLNLLLQDNHKTNILIVYIVLFHLFYMVFPLQYCKTTIKTLRNNDNVVQRGVFKM